ncbi:hypothetical protein [Enterococcus avium]|uniref:hypothetical protein n=1 Tax=Enterococcus avium TaxID=33945 RepID=UPI00187C574A|nr:hypothetical protein [Enterococcus avium]
MKTSEQLKCQKNVPQLLSFHHFSSERAIPNRFTCGIDGFNERSHQSQEDLLE